MCEKMHSVPLFSIAIKEKGSVLCYRKSWYGWSLSCLFSAIFLFNGYVILSAIVGLQLVQIHGMGRRESIRGNMGHI